MSNQQQQQQQHQQGQEHSINPNGQSNDSNLQNQHFHGSHPIDASDVVLYFFAFFFPPFSVYIRTGLCTNDFLLNLLLTALFGVPGTIHAIYIVYVTSPVTGTAERRINRYSSTNGDYERIIENDIPSAQQQQQHQTQNKQDTQTYTDTDFGSSSSAVNGPPPYEEINPDSKKFSTDNKIQRP